VRIDPLLDCAVDRVVALVTAPIVGRVEGPLLITDRVVVG